MAMSQADTILALGTRFNFLLMYGRMLEPSVKVVQVDIEPTELGFNRGPDVGIFGEKDYQQITIIRRSVEDLCLPVEIVGAPTVRADDGLALSSRNRYLSAAERAVAPTVYRALDRARRRLEGGDADIPAIEQEGIDALRAAGFRPDYFEVRMAGTLMRAQGQDIDVVVLTAARLGRARLIDNVQCRATGEIRA